MKLVLSGVLRIEANLAKTNLKNELELIFSSNKEAIGFFSRKSPCVKDLKDLEEKLKVINLY